MGAPTKSTGVAKFVGSRAVGFALLGVVLVALGLSACQPVPPPGPPPLISTTPALFPGFQSSVVDYVNRCDPANPTQVDVNAPSGTTVSVNGSQPQSGSFSVQVAQDVGHRFTIDLTTDGNTTGHFVRCLPADFPQWTVEKNGTPQAAYYATVLEEGFPPNDYGMIFDTNGVPVWWLKGRKPTTLITPLLQPNTDFAIMNFNGGMEEYDLNGHLARALNTVGGNSDFHDVILLPNGNYAMATSQNVPCNLSSWGWPAGDTGIRTCIDHVIQELTPQGAVVGSWDTMAHIPPSETADAWIAQQKQPAPLNNCPTQTTGLCDPYHYNSIEDTGDGFIISYRHLDAVVRINKTTGAIVWKLGGKPHSEGLQNVSLQIKDDPLNGPDSQHDARLLPDGTVTIHDNGTNGAGPSRPPRTLTYVIDNQAKTATFAGQLTDADLGSSFCCGSVRHLPGGNVVVGWGGTPQIREYQQDGTRLFGISGGNFVYRAVPILPGVYTPDQFRAGMDAQYP
ncbi:MAG: aryl-sulfate sulfotransferase [Actinomycetota bacterium]|nr:aryl-sulfate sulfotransferase [Actinomycetota bacterium]